MTIDAAPSPHHHAATAPVPSWAWAAPVLAVLATAAGATTATPSTTTWAALAVVVVATAVATVGLHRHRTPTAGPWLLIVAGLAAASSASLSDQPLPRAVALVGYAAIGAGLVRLARELTRVWDPTRWLDAVVVSGSLAATATAALGPALEGAGWWDRWIQPGVPAVDVLLVLLAVRCLLAVRPRAAALQLLTIGLAVLAVGDALVRWGEPAGLALPAGIRPLGAALATAVVAAGAVHPSVAARSTAALAWRRLGWVRFSVLMASLASPLVALAVLVARGEAEAGATWFACATTVALTMAVLVRVSGLVRYADDLADERHRSRFEALAVHSNDAVAILDDDHRVVWASPAVARVLDVDPEAVVGEELVALVGRIAAEQLAGPLGRLAVAATGTTLSIQTTWDDADGHQRHLEGVVTNLAAEPSVAGTVLVVRDVTERTEMQRQLVDQAFVDPLTGLANRALFADRVAHALSRARAGDQARTAVLFVDVDDFKAVNDSLGHGSGDDLLVVVGRRIADALRPSDTAARLGGDEFGVLLEDIAPEGAMAVAERIIDLMEHPVMVGTMPVRVGASIGVACADDPATSDADLLRNADLAMYEAKRQGKGRACAFRSELHERELRRFTYRGELKTALERGQLHVLYQPIVDLRRREVSGAEALLRWIHPDHGAISPMEFIPLAESTRAIVPIGRWVLETAVAQLAAWQRDLAPGRPLTVDVNVSAVQLLDPGFVDDVAAILAAAPVAPSQVVLELTESILVHDADGARTVLEALRGLGVQLAIDDFGTGYSSLAYLKDFPIDIVKIDRAFVSQLGQAGRGRSLARSIVAIADSLGIGTIAEGIETEDQASDLVDLDCPHGQGFHWSRPVPPEEFAAVVARVAGAPSPT